MGARGVSLLLLLLSMQAPSAQLLELPDPYVFSGETIDQLTYPWFVTVMSEFVDGRGSALCGGFLAHPKYVVTAAHCMYNSHGVATAATFVYVHDRLHRVAIFATRIYIPRVYDGSPHWHGDVAVIELGTPAQNVTMPRVAWDRAEWEALSARNSVRAIGYGVTEHGILEDELRSVDLDPLQSCDGHWAPEITHGDFCAGSSTSDGAGVYEDTCFGDSGGPLFRQQVEGITVFAVVSRGATPCGSGIAPGIYTALYRFRDFITSIIPAPIDGGAGSLPSSTPEQSQVVMIETRPTTDTHDAASAACMRVAMIYCFFLLLL